MNKFGSVGSVLCPGIGNKRTPNTKLTHIDS